MKDFIFYFLTVYACSTIFVGNSLDKIPITEENRWHIKVVRVFIWLSFAVALIATLYMAMTKKD